MLKGLDFWGDSYWHFSMDVAYHKKMANLAIQLGSNLISVDISRCCRCWRNMGRLQSALWCWNHHVRTAKVKFIITSSPMLATLHHRHNHSSYSHWGMSLLSIRLLFLSYFFCAKRSLSLVKSWNFTREKNGPCSHRERVRGYHNY